MIYDGLSPTALASRLKAPRCIVLERVSSTLDILHELAEEGAPAKTLVLADEQARGRGRRGQIWLSPKGSGVWLSYLLRPRRPFESGVLALRVGLAVVDAVGVLGAPSQLKWPNDVVLGARKVCGILCETRWIGDAVSWVAVGIGMNVRGAIPPEIADRAVALSDVLPGVTRIDVLEALVPRLHGLSDQPTLSAWERTTFEGCDWLYSRRVVEPIMGRACGVDADGALLIRTGAGVQRVTGGHIVTA